MTLSLVLTKGNGQGPRKEGSQKVERPGPTPLHQSPSLTDARGLAQHRPSAKANASRGSWPRTHLLWASSPQDSTG